MVVLLEEPLKLLCGVCLYWESVRHKFQIFVNYDPEPTHLAILVLGILLGKKKKKCSSKDHWIIASTEGSTWNPFYKRNTVVQFYTDLRVQSVNFTALTITIKYSYVKHIGGTLNGSTM